MRSDPTYRFYELYFNHEDPLVTLVLQSGRILRGVFVGFFRGDIRFCDPYITHWHFRESAREAALGNGEPGEEIIPHTAIQQVIFEDDHSVVILKP